MKIVQTLVLLLSAVVLTSVLSACATAQPATRPQPLVWQSEVTGMPLAAILVTPKRVDVSKQLPTVVYLKNLNISRRGRDEDGQIIGGLINDGHLVVVIDYAKSPAAVSPAINRDILKLRTDIADGKKRNFLLDQPIDVNRLFIIPEGFTLRRDIEFARDGARVLGADVIYPSNPAQPVPLLMEITCDNVNRMGSFSLLYCRDTLMEGAAFAGFAAAMVDHPVRPPYKGLDDPMPESLHRMQAAVAKLRSLKSELPLNGRIGAIGFSRGGPFAAMLAGQGDVDAALVHGNRYDYLDLLPNDPMFERFSMAWGPLHEKAASWQKHAAVTYLTSRASPMYLSTSDTESAEYRDGLQKLAKWLRTKKIDHVYEEDRDGRGHTVTLDPARLCEIYDFFRSHLTSK